MKPPSEQKPARPARGRRAVDRLIVSVAVLKSPEDTGHKLGIDDSLTHNLLILNMILGGGRGIRTPESLSTLTVFKTGAFNRSAIPPFTILPDSIILRGVSLCRFWLFGLSRHLCHYFVTSRQLRHRARLRIVIRVRVPHGRVDR